MPRTYKKLCRLCESEFTARSWDTKYCGAACRSSAFKSGFADYAGGATECKHCGGTFTKKHLRHAYCATPCKDAAARARGGVPTEQQYARVSGNWRRYLQRLCMPSARRALTADILYKILERQDFKCALTGVSMTCRLVKGTRTWTNASIDRILPGAPYTEDNIRMTCVRINTLRSNMSDSEFISWCRLVVQHSEVQDAKKPPQV